MTFYSPSELNLLSDSLAEEYAYAFGSRPVAPGAVFDDDVLTFSFVDGLSDPEAELRKERRMVELREAREDSLGIVGTILVEPVERFAGSAVGFHAELFDPGSTSTMMMFGFDTPAVVESLDPRHLFLRSQAVRVRARKLRREHVDAREVHVQLRDELRERRRKAAERPDDE